MFQWIPSSAAGNIDRDEAKITITDVTDLPTRFNVTVTTSRSDFEDATQTIACSR